MRFYVTHDVTLFTTTKHNHLGLTPEQKTPSRGLRIKPRTETAPLPLMPPLCPPQIHTLGAPRLLGKMLKKSNTYPVFKS